MTFKIPLGAKNGLKYAIFHSILEVVFEVKGVGSTSSNFLYTRGGMMTIYDFRDSLGLF